MKFCSNTPVNKCAHGPLANTPTSSPPWVVWANGTVDGNEYDCARAIEKKKNIHVRKSRFKKGEGAWGGKKVLRNVCASAESIYIGQTHRTLYTYVYYTRTYAVKYV